MSRGFKLLVEASCASFSAEVAGGWTQVSLSTTPLRVTFCTFFPVTQLKQVNWGGGVQVPLPLLRLYASVFCNFLLLKQVNWEVPKQVNWGGGSRSCMRARLAGVLSTGDAWRRGSQAATCAHANSRRRGGARSLLRRPPAMPVWSTRNTALMSLNGNLIS